MRSRARPYLIESDTGVLPGMNRAASVSIAIVTKLREPRLMKTIGLFGSS